MAFPSLAASGVPDPMDAPPVRWGILGPGGIAERFAQAVRAGTRSRVVAVGSRSAARAEDFARRHDVPRAHGSYAGLVADDEVEAVYIATPHSAHHDNALLALRSGRPVLVEKAFARNRAETDEVLAEAEGRGLLAAEAMWSRYLPHYDVVRRTVAAGVLGEVVLVQADHGQRLWPDGPRRLADPELAGGALLDLGVYCVAFADHVLGGLGGLGGLGDVRAVGTTSPEGVDVTVALAARGAGGVAQLSTSMAVASACTASVTGTHGRLELGAPFYRVGTGIRLLGDDGTILDTWEPDIREHGFRYQIAEVARALEAGRCEPWSVPWAATRRVMSVLDEARRQLGVVYPGE